MAEMCKAAVLVGPGKIETQEFPITHPKEGDILVKMEMSGICGTDKHAVNEGINYGRYDFDPYPSIRGHENVGIIAEIGNKNGVAVDFLGEEARVGDRVVMCPDIRCGTCAACLRDDGRTWCDNLRALGLNMDFKNPPYLFGGWAEYMYLPSNVMWYKIPREISPELAAMAELQSVCDILDRCQEYGGLKFGDTVLVQGAGPLGLNFIVRARLQGAGDIIAFDKSDYRLDIAKKFGADYVVNVDKTTVEERKEIVMGLTGGRGSEMIIEAAGDPATLPEGLALVRRGGMYIEAGHFVTEGTIPLDPALDLCNKNVRLIGIDHCAYITGYKQPLKVLEKFHDRFPYELYVSHKYPIEQAYEAVQKSLDVYSSMKVVITP